MKQVLSLLTAFALFQTQTWALSGGPVFSNVSTPNLAGIYSGAMAKDEIGFADNVTPNNRRPAGTNGVFTITVEAEGLSAGEMVFFVNGTLYTATVTGIADPDKSSFSGIIEGDGQFGVVITPRIVIVNPITGEVTVIPAVVESPTLYGEMELKIHQRFNRPISGRPDFSTGNAARLTGKVEVEIFNDVAANQTPIFMVRASYRVTGFRQTTTPLQ